MAFGYTGRDYDQETGFTYHRSRYYDPQIGTWLSQDSLAYASGDANLYRYVGNAPVGVTDPSGLMSESVVGQSLLWGPSLILTAGTNPQALSNTLDFVGRAAFDTVQSVLDAQPNWVLDSFLWSTAWVEPVARRAGFAAQFLGGATEIAVGAGAFLSPEPAVSKVTGVLLIAHGFDNVLNGARGLYFGVALIREADDGEARLNFTSYWVEQGAEAIGFSEPIARELGLAVDMAVPLGAEIAGSIRIAQYLQRNPEVRASERFQRWHSRGFGTLTSVRSATGRADEILRGGVLTDEWVQLMEAGGRLTSSSSSKAIGRAQAKALQHLRKTHKGSRSASEPKARVCILSMSRPPQARG